MMCLTLTPHSDRRFYGFCGSNKNSHSTVVTDTIPVVNNRPSGVAPTRPDEARLLVTTAAIVDKLLFAWFIGVGLTPQRHWEKFLHTHRLYRPETYQKRLEIFAGATEFCGSQAVTNAKSMLAVSLAKQRYPTTNKCTRVIRLSMVPGYLL